MEDEVDRDKRRESAEKQTSAVDLKKKKEKKKNLERQVLETHRAKSRKRGEPEEESPDEDDGGNGDDNSDDSEGMASCLDRILEGPPPTGVDVLRTEVPKGAPSGSRESQQREPSPRRSRTDTPVGYFKRKQKNPQAHGYRCSFHPGVFQSIDFSQRT